MNEQEIEKRLQESANEIKVRDFSQVWENIQGEVAPVRKKKRRLSRRASALFSAAAAVIVLAVSLPVGLHYNQPAVYYWEELDTQIVSQEVFYQELESSNIDCVDFKRYSTSSYSLFQTENGIMKGGMIELSNDVEPMFMMTVNFYDRSVVLNDTTEVYDSSCVTANGATAEYTLIETQDEYYVFDMKVSYRSVNYYINYTGFGEDVQPFLDSFFQ